MLLFLKDIDVAYIILKQIFQALSPYCFFDYSWKSDFNVLLALDFKLVLFIIRSSCSVLKTNPWDS